MSIRGHNNSANLNNKYVGGKANTNDAGCPQSVFPALGSRGLTLASSGSISLKESDYITHSPYNEGNISENQSSYCKLQLLSNYLGIPSNTPLIWKCIGLLTLSSITSLPTFS